MQTLSGLLCMTALMATADLSPGEHTRSVAVGDQTRQYLLYLPVDYPAQARLPVVLCFHGGGSNPRQMASFCGLNAKADAEGFAVVYPFGSGRREGLLTWNAGNCCGYALRQNVDEISFVKALLDDLSVTIAVDERRIYATGMSNGGMMAYLVADKLADRIAAIAPVGGPLGMETCNPARPVPVLHFHGTDDQFAPFAGGRGARSLTQTEFFSVEHSIRTWVAANGCATEPTTSVLVEAPLRVERIEYAAGPAGAEVVLIKIIGGGHTWPGLQPRLEFLGPATLDVSANDLMWEFFQRHPLP